MAISHEVRSANLDPPHQNDATSSSTHHILLKEGQLDSEFLEICFSLRGCSVDVFLCTLLFHKGTPIFFTLSNKEHLQRIRPAANTYILSPKSTFVLFTSLDPMVHARSSNLGIVIGLLKATLARVCTSRHVYKFHQLQCSKNTQLA
ncbi:hypothetical protein TNCV_298881 [Trichonephila clavipes]|nr:hypothetical protein TNCV_298881 [Trichonephila clavipes]